MSEDFKPKQPTGHQEDPLAKALQDLMEGRSSQAETAAASAPMAGQESGCPDPGAWSRLLSGVGRPAEVENVTALLAHAGQCSSCSGRLRALSLDALPEEAAEVARLASASSEWQHKMAATLARTPVQTSHQARRAPRLYLWAGAALAASLVFGAVFTGWWQRANTPERLLAEAYTHSRSFDLRMPGAGFAEVTPQTHLRGSGADHESSKLLDARARIERQLENAPDDSHWLQLEARADVLDEKFDPAIDILDRLVAAGPVTSSLLVDDAAAYFQRGTATGSENDRSTALEYLRHADELAPDDPVVLFNEAVAMEDRGQLMNAVETWNRYLRFERDPRWLDDGRHRLQALEQKLDQLKTHQSRIDQHLGSPGAMRAMAADSGALAAFDEELSSVMLPRLLNSAFPITVDRSRGSPCADGCQAARALLHALADSLQRNHQDQWLTSLLPAASLPPKSSDPDPVFIQAAHALAQAIDGDAAGDYLAAQQDAVKASALFHSVGNAAGEDRAEVERSYALLRSSDIAGCYQAAHTLFGRNPQFAWIQIHALTQDTLCDPAPGTNKENNPSFLRAVSQAQERHYALLELRARTLLGAAPVEAGDAEAAWRVYLPTIRRFYSGDFPAMRLYGSLSGLEQVEQGTPRVRTTLLLGREALGVLELTQSRQLIPTERLTLAAAAIRAGAVSEAQEQMRLAQSELAANGGGKPVQGFLAENEIAMAKLYLERQDLGAAGGMLDAAHGHMDGEHNSYHRRDYAMARGQLELAEGHPEIAEPMLREAVLEEERQSGKGGEEGIVVAEQDRDLYAALAGVWLAQGRSGEEILALWERYRLRILGDFAPVCPENGLACLKPKLMIALAQLGQDRLLGQVVLTDRLLLYRASAQGVVWTQVPVRREDVLAAAEPLERAVSSPATPMDSVDRSARRVGDLLIGPLNRLDTLDATSGRGGHLLIEPDPLLGNLPWPSVATEAGFIGLQFDLEESPSLLLDRPSPAPAAFGSPSGKPLIVGASIASGESQLLPEVLNEARAVARFGSEANVLLAAQATESQVAARLTTASAIHFAGHAVQQDGGTRLLLAPTQMALSGSSTDRPYLDSDLLRKHPPRAARLAVFSACSTGRKEEGWNHGMDDIVGTLAAQGVPDVVATRWQIDSGSAVPMMDAFYGELAHGLSVPQALTKARQTLILDPRYRHPYYWAAYYASGFGRTDLSEVFHGK
jgi:CHAT domain-containing protein/tetratricopeptide (TPR) repeat protein